MTSLNSEKLSKQVVLANIPHSYSACAWKTPELPAQLRGRNSALPARIPRAPERKEAVV